MNGTSANPRRAVIISGGAVIDDAYIKSLVAHDDMVVCADSGYDHARRLGLAPDVVIGDFDSISGVPGDTECVRYPAEKDMTDTELAVAYAREHGVRHFLILAATGSRLDHTLANILLLKTCLDRGEHAELIDEHNRAILTDSALDVSGCAGALVSLLPLADCVGVYTEGLQYPLRDAVLCVGTSRGVSNVMLGETARVSVREGLLLVVMARD